MDTKTSAAGSRDPVLDFWRGIGVSGVLFQHFFYEHFPAFRAFRSVANQTTSLLHSLLVSADNAMLLLAERAGTLGVEAFFVVSGFIITKIMLDEEAKYGRMSIGRFYVRRIFRILPAYFFYLLSVVVFSAIGWIAFDSTEVPRAAGFLCNINMSNCGWYLIHSWSLDIEEQFYILWPVLFLLLSPAYRASFVAGTIGLLFTLSSAGLLITHGWIDNGHSFVCIALGAFYALHEPFRVYMQKNAVRASLGLLAALALLYAMPFLHAGAFVKLMLRQAEPLLILTCIVLTYRSERLMRSTLFNIIGKLGLVSYSVYLWQQLFTNHPAEYPTHSPLAYSILLIPCVLFSYFIIEKPFIAWSRIVLQKIPRTSRPAQKT